MLNIGVKKAVYICCPNFLHPVLNRVEASEIGYRLAKGLFWSMAGAVISRGLMLAAWVCVARMLGKTGYGELGMIQSTVGMFFVFAGFGLGLTATKHIAEFRSSDPARAGRIISLSWLVAMVTGGLMALGLFIFAPWLAEHTINAPHLSGVLRIGGLILFINALNGAQTGALSGFEAFKTIAHVNLFVGLISFPILVGGAYLGGLTGAVWALAINLGVNWLLNHIALRKEARRYAVPLSFVNCTSDLPVLWKFSLPAVLAGVMVGPVRWACGALLANQPDGYGEIGIFSAALVFQNMLLFASGMINAPLLSMVSNAGANISDNLGTFSIVVFYTTVMIFVAGLARVLAARSLLWWGFFSNTFWAIILIGSAAFLIRWGAPGLAASFAIAYILNTLILVPLYYSRKLVPKGTLLSVKSASIWFVLGGLVVLNIANVSLLLRSLAFVPSMLVAGIAFTRIAKGATTAKETIT
jgi:O-antigen/teichoic acid export membrane protein